MFGFPFPQPYRALAFLEMRGLCDVQQSRALVAELRRQVRGVLLLPDSFVDGLTLHPNLERAYQPRGE